MEQIPTDHASSVAELTRRPVEAPAQRAAGPLTSVGLIGGLGEAVGNRALARLLARMPENDGIMPGGVVHPAIDAAIGAAAGSGRPLDRATSARLGGVFGDDLGDVRVHNDERAHTLARAVSARAFTVGRDIFFGSGEYQPGTSGGDRLLAHEVTHVLQQRGAPATGPLTVTQPGDGMEREAEAVSRGAFG